jgi:hypothetical protein
MKKYLVPLAMVLFLLIPLMAISGENLPAPFLKIKAMAMGGTLTEGIYIWEKKIVINGNEYSYSMGFSPTNDIIGVVKAEGPYITAIIWWGEGKSYMIKKFAYGNLVQQEIISEEQAIKLAYDFFKELVFHKLI